MRVKRSLVFYLSLVLIVFALPLLAHAKDKDLTFFRIGTGGLDGIYYPMGGIIASTISNPPGDRDCDRGGNCGVPGLIAVAKSSDGSISNLSGLLNGALDSAFVQADVLYYAYQGTGLFKGQKPLDNLRVLSSLFDEAIHLVVRKDANIASIMDLNGKRVSIGTKNSDAFFESKLLLDFMELDETNIQALYLDASDAAQKLRTGELDAFFMISGYPSRIISELAKDNLIDLLPITGMHSKEFVEKHKFLSRDIIPDGIYENIDQIETLSISTIWVTTTQLEEQTAYQILQALWHKRNRDNFENAIPAAQGVRYSNSFAGVKTPIHDGAMLFHEQVEVQKSQRILSLDQPKQGPFEALFKAIASEPDK